MRLRRFIFFSVILLVWTNAFTQTSVTPYSSKGIGEIIHPSLITNRSMGGTSIAYPANYNFSLLNPSLLAINSFTSFEVAFTGEMRTITNDSLTQRNGSGNMSYLAISFPLFNNVMTGGISLSPYSYINYNIVSQDAVDGSDDTVTVNYKGSGGINSLAWSNGILLFKSLALGYKVSYLFGSAVDETVMQINNQPAYLTALYERNKIQDFNLSLGMAYRQKLSKNNFINIGGVYETGNNIRVTRQEQLERRQPGNNALLNTDTILYDIKGSFYLPMRYGFGFSFISSGKWVVAGDYLVQDWGEYKDFYGESDGMVKNERFSLGMELIPDITSVNNYMKRIIYRAGFSYEKTPYVINQAQVAEIGINFGVSLPVSRASLVNFALQFGQRGSNSDIVINENYIRFGFGFTYNDRWFIRRQID